LAKEEDFIMSKVRVVWYGLIRNYVDKPEDEFQISGSTTVAELLRSVVDRHDDMFRANIFTSSQKLQPTVIIQLNGRYIDKINGLNTKLEHNSELTITVIPLVTGGG